MIINESSKWTLSSEKITKLYNHKVIFIGYNKYVFIHYVFFGNDFLAGEVWLWSFEFNRGPKLLVKRSRASNMGGLGSEQKQKNATTLSVSINNDKRNPMIKIMLKSFGKWPEKKVNSEKNWIHRQTTQRPVDDMAFALLLTDQLISKVVELLAIFNTSF